VISNKENVVSRYVESRREAWRQRRADRVDRRPEPLICHGCDWNVISGRVAAQQPDTESKQLPAWMVLRARMIDRCAYLFHSPDGNTFKG